MYEQNIDQEISGLIIRYFHQDISADALQELYRWLQESPENKESFFQLKSIHDSLRYQTLLSSEEMNESWKKMERKIELSKAAPRKQGLGKQIFLQTFKYIAIASVACVLGFIIHWRYTNQQDTSALTANYHVVNVPKGGNPAHISLADGTSIQLNVAGTLRCPANFSAVNREVFLDGEAWFDVAEDANNPFMVHLPHHTIMVYGTRFNVEAYPDESIHKVTLLNGSVSIEARGSDGEHLGRINLEPGQQAIFNMTTSSVVVENIDTSFASIWVRKEYKFKDETLENIVKRLEKYYDVNIYVVDDLKNIRYTGTLSFDQQIEHVLGIINYDKKYHVQKSDHAIHIIK